MQTSGYGQFDHDGAHGVSYLLKKGEIPKDKFVCHRCNEKLCVNPDHLYLGTPKQNSQDAQKDGLLQKALTPEKIAIIHSLHLYGWSHKKIAAEVGCAKSMVYYILHNKFWKHLQQ